MTWHQVNIGHLSRAVNLIWNYFSIQSKHSPRVCGLEKKANIGKYFILGIQGTIDIVTTWTWLTHAQGGVCSVYWSLFPSLSTSCQCVKAWRYHGHQQRRTGSVQNQSCVQIIQSLCQGITNNILSISGLSGSFSPSPDVIILMRPGAYSLRGSEDNKYIYIFF